MIKSPLWLVFSVIALAACLYLAATRYAFLQTAEYTTGQVSSVIANNSRCSRKCGKRCTRHYDCTKFSAHVSFLSAKGETGHLAIGAGTSSGHNQPISRATYQVGRPVDVAYDPNDINNCLQNSFMSLWGPSVIALVVAGILFFISLLEPKKSTLRSKGTISPQRPY